MHQRRIALRVRQHEVGFGLLERPHLVGLVVVDRQPVALARAHLVNVLAVDQHAARARQVAAGDQLEQRGLARAVGAHDTDHAGLVHLEIGVQ
jgi:hypothetical protein